MICGLGVGEHFEYWGYGKDQLVELDWHEDATLENGFAVHCLPTRHFSGRGLKANQTLWASFLIETPSQKIYMAGDGGYDSHFEEIGKRFPDIDLAILENGQYNEGSDMHSSLAFRIWGSKVKTWSCKKSNDCAQF